MHKNILKFPRLNIMIEYLINLYLRIWQQLYKQRETQLQPTRWYSLHMKKFYSTKKQCMNSKQKGIETLL